MKERLINHQQKPRPFGMKVRRLNAVTRILLALFDMMLFPQGMWAQVPTTITQTFNAVTTSESGGPAISASEGGLWSVSGSYTSPTLSYNSGIQFTLEHQNNQAALTHSYPVYYASIRPLANMSGLTIDQIDVYFAAALQNVEFDVSNSGFRVSAGPTTTSDGVMYRLQASTSENISGITIGLSNNSISSNETLVLKKIVMTGSVTLDAPSLYYSYDSDKATFSSFTNYNGFLKGYYSIDYVSTSLADVANTEFNGTGFGLQGPCTVTAYVQCGTATSSNAVGKLFGFAESTMSTTYQPNGTVNAPDIVPALPSGATVTYSNNRGVTSPTNPINTSTGVITINGADTESYSASFIGSTSGMSVFNETNGNGAVVSYKLGSFSLTVDKKSLSSDMIQDIPDQTYSGQNIAPDITVYDNGVFVPSTEYSYEANNLNAGAGTLTITALASSNKYTGSAPKSFNILPRPLTTAGTTISLATDSYVYDGIAKTPAVNITVEKGDPMPTLGTDYTVSYSNNTDVGTGKATVTGQGNFGGTVEKPFTITALSITNATISAIGNQTYTGSAIAPEPTVSLALQTDAAGTVLRKGTDYTLAYSSNTNVGTATISVTGIGNFTGTASTTFNIVKATPTVTAPTGKSLTYNGSAQALVNAGSTSAGTLQYSTDGQTYSTSIPSATAAGSYTVYYRVVGDANINDVAAQSVTATIAKAAATIGFASAQVNKIFGDAAFTNALENKGDGKVTGYSSSNTSVATVDANGQVAIVGSGDATITATVADGQNYTYATKTASYQLKVTAASLSGVSSSGYTGTYDAKAHGISVTAPDGATVKYGTAAGSYDLTASPTYTNAGSYTVYYQVTKANFTTVTGSETVTITKANVQVQYVDYVFTTKIGETFNPPYLTLNPANLAVTYSSSDDEIATVDAQTGEVTLVSPGEVKIYAYFAGDANYNSAYDYYILTVLQRDIDPIDKDVVYLMDDEHFMYSDEDGHTKEVKLDNTIIYDILFTLNIDGDPSESDGYDETEHCIVLNHHMYDSRLYNLIFMGIEPGSKEYAEEYTGLTFKVPAGTGYIIIDSRTDGEHWMKVQIGDLEPVAFCHTDREKDYILYECDKDTWVHVYNGGLVSDVSMAPFHRAKKQKGYVKIYSVTRSSSAAAGIERINSDVLESDRWYDLQGNKIERPTKKGLYILEGQKVIVR